MNLLSQFSSLNQRRKNKEDPMPLPLTFLLTVLLMVAPMAGEERFKEVCSMLAPLPGEEDSQENHSWEEEGICYIKFVQYSQLINKVIASIKL